MTAKANKPDTQPLANAAQVKINAELRARVALIPELNAAAIAEVFSVHDKLDVMELMDALKKRSDTIARGDTQGIESMLVSQAHALDSMFASLARRAKAQDTLPQYEAHMKFALRAQAQCRATLETLATIKNPPNVAFVKQANIANGPQQVNNGTVARTEEKANAQTELLGNDHGQRLDNTTPSAAGASDSPLETVEAIHGAANGERQNGFKP